MHKRTLDVQQEGLEPQVVILRVSNMFVINYNYLVIDHIHSESILVDPAWDLGKIQLALDVSNTTLKGILLTHSHFDHIQLAKPLAEKYNCPIWMSREEVAISGYEAAQLQPIDEESFRVGSLKIVPLLTPGHTQGSMCYLIGNNLFTGDTLFIEGCGLCPNQEAAYNMFESLEKIKQYVKKTTRIYPGHKYARSPGEPFADVLQNNIYLQFSKKEDFASYRLRKGQKYSKFFEFY
ncbi:MBL fold metallo-hydrolase [Kordia sp.]|uniref:MBL fold metallo-hydrolase n=1 Tax=Kordia sp. TaxID=1965332 RepID=UPI0025BB24AF|nr:MBL fold metallo-hydrolase [Kordia sp.]MCH2193542.1 MBL fold metallo-hydrolase [Kordia sp.]